MKRAELRPGVVYAYEEPPGQRAPFMLLEQPGRRLWAVRSHHRDRLEKLDARGHQGRPYHPREGDWRTDAQGWLALWGPPEKLAQVDPDVVLATLEGTARQQPDGRVLYEQPVIGLPVGVHFALLTSLSKVTGEYKPATTPKHKRERGATEQPTQAEAGRTSNQDRAQHLAAQLQQLGLTTATAQPRHGDNITISLDDAATLAGILRTLGGASE